MEEPEENKAIDFTKNPLDVEVECGETKDGKLEGTCTDFTNDNIGTVREVVGNFWVIL